MYIEQVSIVANGGLIQTGDEEGDECEAAGRR